MSLSYKPDERNRAVAWTLEVVRSVGVAKLHPQTTPPTLMTYPLYLSYIIAAYNGRHEILVSSAQTFALGTCSSLAVDADCRGDLVTVSTDAGLALDIVQVSTSDTRKTQSKLSHVRYQVIYFSHFLQLSPSLRVLIASDAAVTFAALHW